ncbi:MAG TPA: hypothetical protein VF524_02795 [Polyangia bacterium]
MIVDVISRHEGPRKIEKPLHTGLTAITDEAAPTGSSSPGGGGSLSGYARQPPAPAIFLTLIDALFSP